MYKVVEIEEEKYGGGATYTYEVTYTYNSWYDDLLTSFLMIIGLPLLCLALPFACLYEKLFKKKVVQAISSEKKLLKVEHPTDKKSRSEFPT